MQDHQSFGFFPFGDIVGDDIRLSVQTRNCYEIGQLSFMVNCGMTTFRLIQITFPVSLSILELARHPNTTLPPLHKFPPRTACTRSFLLNRWHWRYYKTSLVRRWWSNTKRFGEDLMEALRPTIEGRVTTPTLYCTMVPFDSRVILLREPCIIPIL